MLKNYLKIAWRNLRKHPSYWFINIFGLALGMAVSILILLYVQDELSYDKYHEKSDRIYRVSREWFNQNGETSLHLGHAAPPFGPMLKQEFEVIQEMVRFYQIDPLVKYQEKAFVEGSFDEQYASERHLGNVFGYFALLAVIIASLGLFGLASFTAQQRIKEIGIRKALGATVSEIVLLLSKRFTLLVLLSIAVAAPIAWYAMSNWLQGFAYRIDIPILTFLWAGSGAILIAWLTVSYQSIKAARVNPVQSLRSE